MDDLPEIETPAKAARAVGIAFAIAIILALGAVFYLTPRAHAQPATIRCDKLTTIIDDLGQKFGEVIQWEGSKGQAETMLFQSEKGTWSIVQSKDGVACITAFGESGTPIGPTDEGA